MSSGDGISLMLKRAHPMLRENQEEAQWQVPTDRSSGTS
jgi:hypothetical protein